VGEERRQTPGEEGRGQRGGERRGKRGEERRRERGEERRGKIGEERRGEGWLSSPCVAPWGSMNVIKIKINKGGRLGNHA